MLPIRSGSSGHYFFSSVLHYVCDGKVQAGVTDYALTFFDVCSFKPHNDRNADAEIFRRVDHTARDHVTTDNTAKDIDKHSFDMLVPKKDFEGGLDPRLRRTASNIQEICWFTASELYNVHRRHIKS